MRKSLFCFALIMAQFITAQDKIVTKEGDVFLGWGIEIGQATIFYRTAEADDAPIKKINKDEILMVRYADGRKVMIGEDSPKQEVQEPERKANSAFGNASNKEVNQAAKARFNSPVPTLAKGATNSKASCAVALFGLTEDSEIADNNVELEFFNGARKAEWSSGFSSVLQGFRPFERQLLGEWLQIVVRNKTDKIVFVDLANCFISRNGETESYYKPEATSTAYSKGNGIGVDFGGINVSGGKSTTSTTTVFSQRIVAVPPKSSIALDGKYTYYPHEKRIGLLMSKSYAPLDEYANTVKDTGKYVAGSGMTSKYVTLNYDKSNPLKNGEHLSYSETQVKDRTEFTVTYSFSEDFSTSYLLQPRFYLKDIIGLKAGATGIWKNLTQNLPGIEKCFGIVVGCSSSDSKPAYPRP